MLSRTFPFPRPPAKVMPLGRGERVSRQHLNAYRTKLAQIHAASGSLNEGPISQAFGSLLES